MIGATLVALGKGAPGAELIVVDGGSTDRSVQVTTARGARILPAPRGRARQMNAGAAAAHGEVFAFVHADTLVPATFAADIAFALANPHVVGGRFDVKLDDTSLAS
ncbi:MAG TPA: glycosyltransferase, partial [Candidatus Binataceae bacterium]|nr:glycosyltransferase [Candidatus Binataceae bacterium]